MSLHSAKSPIRTLAAAWLCWLAVTGAAQASPVTWTLSGVQFDDGTTVTGSFVFDADTTSFSGLQLTTSGGTSVPAASSWVFNTNNLPLAEQNAFDINAQTEVAGFQAVDALGAAGNHAIGLFGLGQLMTNAGGVIDLGFMAAGTCLDSALCDAFDDTLPFSTTGTGQFVSRVSAVPEPEGLSLALVGLIAAGAATRRRRR